MNRNELAELRPNVNFDQSKETKSLEHFQNEVLRPIIKFQHEFILAYVKGNSNFLKLISDKGTRVAFQTKTKLFIGSQPHVKNQLIGSIIGLLTEKELDYYFPHATEINKRINQMICQRIADTLY